MNPFGGNGALSLAAAAAVSMNPGAGGFGVGDNSGLASQAARMGFAHGAQLQQQAQQAAAAAAQAQQQSHAQQLHHQQVQAHAQHQQHHTHHQLHAALGEPHPGRMPAKGRIREVWKHNLAEEMAAIRDLVDRYPYIAMVSAFVPLCLSLALSLSSFLFFFLFFLLVFHHLPSFLYSLHFFSIIIFSPLSYH